MPKVDIKYENTIIYKIVCNDLSIKELYVGHTTNFRIRKNRHKSMCNNERCLSYNLKVYQFIRANGGWENFTMIEIEKFTCDDSNEATKRERFWLESLNATLNCNIPSRSRTEYYEHVYRENRESILEYQKTYRGKNKESIAAFAKTYRNQHKESLAEYIKTYNMLNRERLLKKQIVHVAVNLP